MGVEVILLVVGIFLIVLGCCLSFVTIWYWIRYLRVQALRRKTAPAPAVAVAVAVQQQQQQQQQHPLNIE